jgi:hypothetical protein
MNSQHFRLVEELFIGALPLGPDSRKAYLDRECGDDSDLRSDVDSLLARRTQAEGFLESQPNVTDDHPGWPASSALIESCRR